MSETVLERQIVREYLRALDAASAVLPVAQARELREMIVAHLDEALPAEATEDEVSAELSRLGSPRALAAAAVVPSRFAILRMLGNRVRRVRWWVWAAVAVLVPALGTGAGFYISMETATPLYVIGTGWLYPVDQAHQVRTSVGMSNQTTVPIRTGQRQGIEFGVWNTSDWTQQIMGTDPGWNFDGFVDVQVSVQSGPHLNMVGSPLHGTAVYYAPSGSIPPHSFRFVRVTWITRICLVDNGNTWFSDIPLQVRVGTITRTEDVTLDDETFALTGPSQGGCG
jgi:hypothetical protein